MCAYVQVGGAVLTEDTSLCFDALKGLPGPYMYVMSCLLFPGSTNASSPSLPSKESGSFTPPLHSKWFLHALGHEGLNNLLLAYDDKTAQAVCTFAYSEGPSHEPLIFQGKVTVSTEPSLRPLMKPVV